MKRFNVILVGACILVLFGGGWNGCAPIQMNVVKQSTVDGNIYSYIDVDPVVIAQTWTEFTRVPYSQFVAEIYFQNPDEDADIQFATLMATPAGLALYSYMINGNINVCEFNVGTNAYESIWDTLTDEFKAQWKADYEKHFGLDSI